MSLRMLRRGTVTLLLGLALAAGGAGAAAAAEPAKGFGVVQTVSPAEGVVVLRRGERLQVSRSTEVVEAGGGPLALEALAGGDREDARVWYEGRRLGETLQLDRLVVGVEAPR